jgi:hypothetical protein
MAQWLSCVTKEQNLVKSVDSQPKYVTHFDEGNKNGERKNQKAFWEINWKPSALNSLGAFLLPILWLIWKPVY